MIRLSIRRPVAISMAYVAIALLGVAAWQNIPIELLPDTRLPRLNISASWPGASPETTEAFLTSPLEAEVQQVRGIESVVSTSGSDAGSGRAQISVEFARDTDMDFARLELSERLASVEDALPEGVQGPYVTPYVPEEFAEQTRPFLQYTVTGPYTLQALRAHVDEVIAAELRRVDGVADVSAYGGRDRVLELELDEAKVHALGLRLDDVRRRIEELQYVAEAGAVRTGATRRPLAIRQRIGSALDVLRTPLLTDGNRVVRVSDVARVRDTYEEPTSYYRIDAMPAVSFSVLREIGTNAVDVADRVKARLAQLEGRHPPGLRLILDEDESEAIRTQLTDLRFRALISAAVVFVVLLLFLRSLRSAGIVFATIAFSVLITLNLIYFGGHTLNVLTLMGVAMGFGLIVDNAIVVLENMYRLRQRGLSATEAAERGAREVVLAVLAATLTTVVVLIPFVYLQGELRVYYVPLAIVVGFSLVASLLVAFTFIPALAGKVLGVQAAGPPVLSSGGQSDHASAGTPSAPSDVMGQVDAPGADTRGPPIYVRFYSALVGFTLRFPWVTVVLALAALWGSYHLFDKYVSRGVLWRAWWEQETYIDVRFSLPRGEELQRTDALVRYFEDRLRTMPEVERFVTNVRTESADIRVSFPDSIEQTAIPVVIKEQMVAFSHLFGGADVRVYGFGPSFYGGGGSPPNYSIEILGYNYEMVRAIAEDLALRLEDFSRIREVDTNSARRWYVRDKATEMVVRLNRPRLALHGLSARDVVRQVRAAVGGRSAATRLQVAGEEVQFALKLEGHRTLNMLELHQVLIPAASGAGVRLADVAVLEERQVLNEILREDQQYQRMISYEFRGPRKLGDVIRDVVVAATQLPAGYTIETESDYFWADEEREQIYGVLAVALVLVFMVTAALFESLRQPLCVLLTVPMALIGVFLIFFYTGASFTREAYIGVIMMGGIVVNNAILLVDHINQLRRNDGLALEQAIKRGTLERVRPILMTTTTTIFGLLPLVLFSASADANIWNALGYALIGGLASSTLLVLTVTPALYMLFERRKARRVDAAALRPEAAPA